MDTRFQENDPRPRAMARWLPMLLLISLVAAVYWSAVGYEFIGDDHSLIERREAFLANEGGLAQLMTHGYWWGTGKPRAREDIFRPWSTWTFWAHYTMGGVNPAIYHASNIVVHAASMLLLLLVLTPITGRGMALAVACLSAVSSSAMSAAVWVSGRTDLWALFFTLLFMLAIRAAIHRPRWYLFVGAGASWFLALCSKEVAIVAPFLAWLVVFYESRRKIERRGRVVGVIASLAVPLGGYLILRSIALPSAGIFGRLASFVERLPYLAEQVLRTAFYNVIPLDYSMERSLAWSGPGERGILFALGWLAFLLLVGIVIAGLRRKRLWAVGGAWFGICLFPSYGMGQTFAPLADFYAYTALPGLWLFVLDGARSLPKRLFPSIEFPKRVRVLAAAILVLAIGGLTFLRMPVLSNDIRFVTNTATHRPDSLPVLMDAAKTFFSIGDPKQGIEWTERAWTRFPSSHLPPVRLARYWLEQQDVHRAAPYVDTLSVMAPAAYETLTVTGLFYYEAGRCDLAVQSYSRAFRTARPADRDLYDCGLALICLTRYAEAAQVYELILERQPYWGKACNNLAACYELSGQSEPAITYYQRAVQLDPSIKTAWKSLVSFYLASGQRLLAEEAAEHYLALESDPRKQAELRERLR